MMPRDDSAPDTSTGGSIDSPIGGVSRRGLLQATTGGMVGFGLLDVGAVGATTGSEPLVDPADLTSAVTAPLERLPVFVPAGGILPLQPHMGYVGQQAVDPLRLRVGTGADGSFDLYEDGGQGSEFQDGEFSTVPISFTGSVDSSPGYARGDPLLSIGPREGGFPEQLRHRGYEVEFLDVAAPSSVRVDGRPLGADAWSYDPDIPTLTVHVESRSVDPETTVSFETG